MAPRKCCRDDGASTAAQLLAVVALVVHAGTVAQAQYSLDFTLTTLQDVADPSIQFDTWISLLATSLLPASTPGVFLGTVPTDAVETTCKAVEAGHLSLQATVTVSGTYSSHQIQVQHIGGCDASAASPQGVELVYIDENGITSAVICDGYTQDIGCQLYATGDDVTNYYNGAVNGQNGNGNRKLLDAGCAIAGAVTGTSMATGTAAVLCEGSGIFYLACVGTASVIGFVGGAIVGCSVMATASCFPGDSLVVMRSGQQKFISQLEIGDQVATLGKNGIVEFDSIYAFGHVDGVSYGLYFKVTIVEELHTISTNATGTQRTLQLSAKHFVPTLDRHGNHIYKRAQDINIGDKMWALMSVDDSISLFIVKDITIIKQRGLYNPFTLGGSIIVNGVVASTHSDWFLDNMFDAMGITQWLPNAYQVVLYPARFLYQTLGARRYQRLYSYINKNLDDFDFNTKYEGLLATIWIGIFFMLGFIFSLPFVSSRAMKHDKIVVPTHFMPSPLS